MEEYVLLCPGAKHPPKLRWSPEASQGLQVPALTTSPHLLCATPLESIKHFIVAAACKQWLPAPEERPALGSPPCGRVSQYLPSPYQKVAAARVLRSPAARWWSLNKPPADLTPNILRSLWAAHRNLQTSPVNRRATVPSGHPPAPPGSTQGDGSQSKLSVLGVCPKYEPARTGRRWKGDRKGKKEKPQAPLHRPSHEPGELPVAP